MADDTARNFLGLQLGCARCHNHPHDQWKLEDFYGLAAFYGGMERDTSDPQKLRSLLQQRNKSVEMQQEIRSIVRLKDDGVPNIAAEIKGEYTIYHAKF